MKNLMQTVTVLLLVYSATPLVRGAEVPIPLQVVPQGIESVNGSDVTMGCAQPLQTLGVQFCGRVGANITSYLFDDISPAIDTSATNWASQLVTVRKNSHTTNIPFDHVVLTFDSSPAVSLSSIELDLFLCPELNIGAPNISVYADENGGGGLAFLQADVDVDVVMLRNSITPSQSSCRSLSTVSIPLPSHETGKDYYTWHIVVSFDLQPNIEWVHVGEVRLLNTLLDIVHSPTRPADTSTTMSLRVTSSTFGTYPPTSATAVTTTHCVCSESRSTLIAVSAVSLVVIVALVTVVLTQCLLMARMRKSLLLKGKYKAVTLHASSEIYSKTIPTDIDATVAPNEAYAVPVISPTTVQVPVTRNEAYGVHNKRTAPQDDYELVPR